ncbi:MAG: hypothetical protein Q9166_004169 [cf. Caloplaca sp. 2 TL-2023]
MTLMLPPLSPVVALSGLSSTGKSTIASILPSIFPPPRYTLIILHVDDFYKPQSELPLREELLDWDCVESLDWPRLEDTVRRWKDGGEVKEGKVNPQPHFGSSTAAAGKNDKGEEGGRITQPLVEQLRDDVLTADVGRGSQRILILDGFLLFTPSVPASFQSLIDLKCLLRAPYAEAKRRREARSGYQTMEGWWEDPPGYFDKVVWPNYVDENKGLFVNEDVDGNINEELCDRYAVKVWMGRTDGLGEALRWVVGEVRKVLEVDVE